MSTDCYVDAGGCIVCPQVIGSPGRPATTTSSPAYGWNAGANSQAVLDGDVSVTDTIDSAPVDLFVGLKASRKHVGAPATLTHALRFTSVGAGVVYEVWEQGRKMRAAATYTLGNTWEIRRVNGVVTTFVNGLAVYESASPSHGPVLVSACLYSAGDAIP